MNTRAWMLILRSKEVSNQLFLLRMEVSRTNDLLEKLISAGRPAKVLWVTVQDGVTKSQGVLEMITLTDNGLGYDIVIQGELDALGNPVAAASEGPFTWALSDTNLGTLTVAADTKSAHFDTAKAAGHLGAGSIIATDNNAPTVGLKSDFTVVAGPAASVGFVETLTPAAPAV